MKQSESNGHQLLIQKLLVSIHYLTLFRDEIVLVEKTPSLLGASFSPFVVQSELGDILNAVDALAQQEKLIKSTFWYDEASFRLMNLSLDIVGTWLRGIDHIIDICESKSVFQAILGDSRARVFGVLIDVFTSLRVTNIAIREDADYPILLNPLDTVRQESEKNKLLAKIDAMVPEIEMAEEESSGEIAELLTEAKEEVMKQFSHFLIDQTDSYVYVIDAEDDLSQKVAAYNAFDRFVGGCHDMTAALDIIEDILVMLEERSEERFDAEGNLTSDKTRPIYLFIYGYNQLLKNGRFANLMTEMGNFLNRTDLHLFRYRAYD